jgi:hypothetical protein
LREKWNAYLELPREEKLRFTEAAAKPSAKPTIPKIGAPPIKPLSGPPPRRVTAHKIPVTPPPAPIAPEFTPPESTPSTTVMIEPVTPAAVPANAPAKP